MIDPATRRQFGLAFASAAAANPRFQRVSFWTSPDGGAPGMNAAYPLRDRRFLPTAQLSGDDRSLRHSLAKLWSTCKRKDIGVIRIVHASIFHQWLHLSSPLTAGPAGKI